MENINLNNPPFQSAPLPFVRLKLREVWWGFHLLPWWLTLYLLLSATPCWCEKGKADLKTNISQLGPRISWDLVRNPNDGAPPHTTENTESETLGWGSAICALNKPRGDSAATWNYFSALGKASPYCLWPRASHGVHTTVPYAKCSHIHSFW